MEVVMSKHEIQAPAEAPEAPLVQVARRGRRSLALEAGEVRLAVEGRSPVVTARVTATQANTFKRIGGAPSLRAWLDSQADEKEALGEHMRRLESELQAAAAKMNTLK